MHAELTLGLGITVGHGAVELLMHRAGIKGLPGNRRARAKHQTPTAGDLVHRQFARLLPDQLWVTDITEHPTREAKQFTSWAFTDRARASVLVPSMGSIGDCYDNAMIESFWGWVQAELLNRQRWRTRIELANALSEYLEIFHNRRRRHSALGMLTPIEISEAQPVA